MLAEVLSSEGLTEAGEYVLKIAHLHEWHVGATKEENLICSPCGLFCRTA